jgi:hypothetical protein
VETARVAPPVTATTTAPPTPQKPVVAAAQEIPESQKRRIILFVDNLSLHPFNRNRVFKEMKGFVKATMRPGDEGMIATYNRSLKVRVPFTRDVTVIQSTLDAIAGESALGVSARSERNETESRIRDAQSYNDALAYARTYSQSIEHDLRQSVSS